MPESAALWGGRCLALLASSSKDVRSARIFSLLREGVSSADLTSAISMSEFALSPAAQHWINVVLIWVGFGTLAGLLATVVFPIRRSIGPFLAMVMGTLGSTLGLLGLSWLFPGQSPNPISPLGFLAATIGAFVLLVFYRLGGMCFAPRDGAGKERN
jgi:uncharacterized membrane protein YeaQ/YmgE (transglycosylase-associated protein family)